MRFGIWAAIALTACQTVETKPKADKSISKPVASQTSATKGEGYTRTFRNLPLAASLSRLPWPSDSWATVHGGAGFRWQLAQGEQLEDLDDLEPFIQYPIGAPLDAKTLSPIEKLDLYLGHKDWTLTRKERERTLGQKNADGSLRREIPEWEGIMHAWSIASLQFAPVAAVTLTNKDGQAVTFEPQDTYSLLSLFIHEQAPKPQVLASVCPQTEIGASASPYGFENDKQALRRKSCGTLDPASFHIVLGNQIGKKNEGFVMDRDLSGEISNNPVVAYESRLIEEPGANSQANQPRTVHLRTIVFLTAETPVNTMDEEDEAYPYETEAYEYELNLDAKGQIVGGRWLKAEGSDANQAIPDFLWKTGPIWLNGPIKAVYEQASQKLAEEKGPKQLRPIEDMPTPERQALNSYFNARPQTNF